MPEYRECKIIEKKTGATSANYKLECIDANNKKKILCVKGQTLNENAAKQMCRSGEYDRISDCQNWP